MSGPTMRTSARGPLRSLRHDLRRQFTREGEGQAARAILLKLAELKRQGVQVGVPVGAVEPDGTSLALIAAALNFGVATGRVVIPERPWIVPGLRSGAAQQSKLNARNLAAVVRGDMTPAVALGQLGALAAGNVQRYIRTADFTPNAPSTIAAKGSSKPLIDTGHFWQSITYEVVEKTT